MLLVKMIIYDGCNWTHRETTQLFKNKKEMQRYIDACHAWMDDVEIRSIEKVKKEDLKK